MKLYLTSVAANVTREIVEDLEGKPSTFTVGFIDTPSHVYEDPTFVEDDRDALEQAGFRIRPLDIEEEGFSERAKECDIIFVSEGNTFYFLQQLKKNELVFQLAHLAKQKIYIGSSAGSVILSPDISPIAPIDEPEKAPALQKYASLAVIDFLPAVHWDNEKYSEKLRRMVREHPDTKFVTLNDDQLLIVTDNSITITEGSEEKPE